MIRIHFVSITASCILHPVHSRDCTACQRPRVNAASDPQHIFNSYLIGFHAWWHSVVGAPVKNSQTHLLPPLTDLC